MRMLTILFWVGVFALDCMSLQMLSDFGDVYHIKGVCAQLWLGLGENWLKAHQVTSPSLANFFTNQYLPQCMLKLPYAEIEEPFEAWLNTTAGKSRIQYYQGQVITYQFGSVKPFGASFKVTPESTESKLNVRKCFRVNGTSAKPIGPQSVFPKLSDFQPVRHEYYRGRYCTVLESVSYWGKKKNIYTLWIAADASFKHVPVHYEMKGFNTLLGSHYDKYEIDYTSFSPSFPSDVFNLPHDLMCEYWPETGPEHRIMANPMQEFVGGTGEISRHHEHLFHLYKEKFGKRYTSEKENERRKHNFIHNMRYIHSKNRANLSYMLAVNHLADHTPEEMAVLRGRLNTGASNNGTPFPSQGYGDLALPESLDWRLYGAVTPVKDQAVCGSCWSFATTGTLEGALFLRTGVLTPLSQQILIDCSWGFGNHACDGGEEWHAYEWIRKHGGIASTESYGPYMGQNGYCHYNKSELIANISGYVNVPSENATALKAALFKHGPVAVNIDASQKSFAFYANGVYYEPNCGNKNKDLDHAVLAVGYGVLQGESFWLIKNSWSTYWGNDGYILMSMKDNNCGVTTAATYPILA